MHGAQNEMLKEKKTCNAQEVFTSGISLETLKKNMKIPLHQVTVSDNTTGAWCVAMKQKEKALKWEKHTAMCEVFLQVSSSKGR